ncbi:molybdopterin biosynthesis protein CNX1 [Selaginella moellendorffii]|uniref:molybdopterin biosynthesis protein CNX1 n=1 Tax=Selaginella moellendorffii TaxID=88036 RepID=UPI000D1CD4E8|nr:molybdopterin biosynthesis protein CNX1 [Selaginella moellendorffii]|eukprot:XP_024519171.1 molybdopterin biosynthesis protein CNX1 [Selaginella moellendorffii]
MAMLSCRRMILAIIQWWRLDAEDITIKSGTVAYVTTGGDFLTFHSFSYAENVLCLAVLTLLSWRIRFDIAKRDKVLSAVAEIASVGTTKVKVESWSVSVFPLYFTVLSFQIRDSNRPMLVTAVRSHQCTCIDLGIARDIETGIEAKLDIPQGKPLTFATLAAPGSNKKMLVFGLPRNPVSGMVTFDLITLSLAKSTGRQASGCLLVCANTLLELPKGPGVLTAGSLVSNRDITSKSKPVKTPDPTKPGIKKSILIVSDTEGKSWTLFFWTIVLFLSSGQRIDQSGNRRIESTLGLSSSITVARPFAWWPPGVQPVPPVRVFVLFRTRSIYYDALTGG